ncbi:hypothetical protein LINGRAPRIM_LOCUS2425, partial [Linum grandiflorum]
RIKSLIILVSAAALSVTAAIFRRRPLSFDALICRVDAENYGRRLLLDSLGPSDGCENSQTAAELCRWRRFTRIRVAIDVPRWSFRRINPIFDIL